MGTLGSSKFRVYCLKVEDLYGLEFGGFRVLGFRIKIELCQVQVFSSGCLWLLAHGFGLKVRVSDNEAVVNGHSFT